MKRPKGTIRATMKTNKGSIRLDLYLEKTPLTVANFSNLAKRGYYDGLKFHRVIEDFMVQGGCPLGIGSGGPGYDFADECRADLKHDEPGVLSMANSGPGTNGSQFFITHVETAWLDGKHTVFGKVVAKKDMKVVNEIAQGDIIETLKIDGELENLPEEVTMQLDIWNALLDELS